MAASTTRFSVPTGPCLFIEQGSYLFDSLCEVFALFEDFEDFPCLIFLGFLDEQLTCVHIVVHRFSFPALATLLVLVSLDCILIITFVSHKVKGFSKNFLDFFNFFA